MLEHSKNWQHHTFRAMGSQINLWLETPHLQEVQTAFAQAEALFATNEQALSRFRPDSELSYLNDHTNEWVTLSPLFWDVLLQALGMAAVTNGYFDPTILNALEGAGYTSSFESLETAVFNGKPPHYLCQQSECWSDVRLQADDHAVWIPQSMRIDLGGIGKGYTAHQAMQLLDRLGPCLVDAGGDLVAGRAPENTQGWPVAISAPWTSNKEEPVDLFQLKLANAALATSGIDYRRWLENGRLAHHLIDPFTRHPADTDIVTATVLAESADVAEAWATTVLVAGTQNGLTMLLDAELAGLLITQDGTILVTPEMEHYLQN